MRDLKSRSCVKCGFVFSASKCSVCAKVYREANKDAHNKSTTLWAKNNKEKVKLYPSTIRAAKKKIIYSDSRRAVNKKYEDANKEIRSAKAAIYSSVNKEKMAAYKVIYQINNPEVGRRASHKRRALKKQCTGSLSKGIGNKLLLLQNNKCACCKKSVKKTGYHLDHVMPLALGGSNTDDNIQILCPKCNMQKGAKHPQDFMQSRGFLF